MRAPFGTIADTIASPSTQLSTGLPQLDRVAPLRPGHLAVLIGKSGVGKSKVAGHIVSTVNCTHDPGVLRVTESTTLEGLDATLSYARPALVLIDPLTALLTDEARATVGAGTSRARAARLMEEIPSDEEPPDFDAADADADSGSPVEIDQYPVKPEILGELAENLRTLAGRHQVPVMVCHRHGPIRDPVTDKVLSTEAINPLLDVADLAIVVRVLADPRTVGLEIIRNSYGPAPLLRVPLGFDSQTRYPLQRRC